MDELARAREASASRLIWGLILLVGIAALIVVFIATRTKPVDVICRRWDHTDVVIAQRYPDRITFTDHNGLLREISGPESAEWDCEK